LRPERRRGFAQVRRFATESEFAGVERAARAIRPVERVGHLREGNFRRGAGSVPGAFIPALVAGKTGADFPAERIETHFETDPAFADPGKIDADRVEIETAHERERADGEPAFLPRSRAAQIGKTFLQPGRRNRNLACAANAGLDLRAGDDAIADVDDGQSVFEVKLNAREFEIVREKIFEKSPVELLSLRGGSRVLTDVERNGIRSERSEETSVRIVEDSLEIQIDFETGRGACRPEGCAGRIRDPN